MRASPDSLRSDSLTGRPMPNSFVDGQDHVGSASELGEGLLPSTSGTQTFDGNIATYGCVITLQTNVATRKSQ